MRYLRLLVHLCVAQQHCRKMSFILLLNLFVLVAAVYGYGGEPFAITTDKLHLLS